jgi:SAM-dependent methyltransferase
MKGTSAPAWKRFARAALWPLMPGWPDEARRIVQGPRLRFMIERAAAGAKSPFKRILNAGAGEGSFSGLLLRGSRAASVVELDPSYASRPRARIDVRQQIVAGSVTEIALADASVDLVLCTEVLEHIRDDGRALDELRRVLTCGGWLLISVPTPPAVYDPDHVREGYTTAALCTMLSQRGLEIIEVAYCMHAGFRAIMRLHRRWGRWLTKAPVWSLSLLDRFCPIGKPMDLVILARAPAGNEPAAGSDRDGAQNAACVA